MHVPLSNPPKRLQHPPSACPLDDEATALTVLTRPKLAVSISGSIGDQPVTVCGDQGAQTSIICLSVISALSMQSKVEPLSNPVMVRVGTGQVRLATGSILLPFSLGGCPFTHRVLVVPNFSGLFLLGIDFFEAHQWTKPDPHQHYYIFDIHKRVPYEPHPLHLENDPIRVTTTKPYKVPVGATVHILGLLDSTAATSVKVDDEGLLRPDHLTTSSIKGLEIPYSIVKVYDYKGMRVRAMLTNVSRQPIRIPSGTCIGIMSCSSFAGIVNTVPPESTPASNVPAAPSTPSSCQSSPASASASAQSTPAGSSSIPSSCSSSPSSTSTQSLPDGDFIGRLQQMSLSPDKAKQILDILFRRRDVFAVNPRRPNLNHVVSHHIDTGDAKPFKSKPFNYSPQEEEIIRKEVLQLLELGIVRPSSSPWAANVVLSRKPDGSIRTCYDARKINKVTKQDRFTLPRTQDLLRRFKGARYFSVLDCAAGFYGVPLTPDSCEKTAFITRFGLYEYTCMPFGLVNAPATYQRLMSLVMGNLQWRCVCVYVDDCCVYSPTWEQHLKDLDEVLSRLQQSGVNLKLSKCSFGQQQVRYLGLQLSGDGHSTDPNNLTSVVNMAPPSNPSELRSFMGLLNYYRQYVPHFADIAEPLNALLRYAPSDSTPNRAKAKGKKQTSSKRDTKFQPQPWTWTEVHQKAFEQLKQLLLQSPILAYPDFTGEYPFILDTDASGVGLGAVLSQRYPNGDRVLGYFSYSLSAKERGWSITEREAYAIVKAVRHFRHIIAGMPFTVVTDHHALRYLLEMKDPYGKINRWVTELQQYQLSIQHRSGVNHSNADAMSRPPVVQPSPDADHHPCDEPDGTVSLRDLLSHVAPRPPSSSGISDVSINASTTIRPSSTDPVLLSQQLPPINRIQELQRQDPVLMGYITYIQDGSLENVAPTFVPC